MAIDLAIEFHELKQSLRKLVADAARRLEATRYPNASAAEKPAATAPCNHEEHEATLETLRRDLETHLAAFEAILPSALGHPSHLQVSHDNGYTSIPLQPQRGRADAGTSHVSSDDRDPSLQSHPVPGRPSRLPIHAVGTSTTCVGKYGPTSTSGSPPISEKDTEGPAKQVQDTGSTSTSEKDTENPTKQPQKRHKRRLENPNGTYPGAKQPKAPLSTATRLAAALCDQRIFYYLCKLITAWKERTEPLFQLSDDRTRHTTELVSIIGRTQNGEHLQVFLNRLAKALLAAIVEDDKTSKKRKRASSVVIDQFAVHLPGFAGETGSKEQRKKRIMKCLAEGRIWNRLCSGSPGLLALIPPTAAYRLEHPNGVSGREYLDLPEDDYDQLRKCLDESSVGAALLQMGKDFRDCIQQKRELPTFVWEGFGHQTITTVSKAIIPCLCKAFRDIVSNQYDEDKFCTEDARPLSHNGRWPVDPTIVGEEEEVKCERCESTSSDCSCVKELGLENPSPPTIRVGEAGAKGRGVFATAKDKTRRIPVFKAGDILGELVGELTPALDYDGEPSLDAISRFDKSVRISELRRDDMDSDNVLCYVDTRYMGNWVRIINHSCRPSCQLKNWKIGGRWRVVVMALRDIVDGEEVTTNYGDDVRTMFQQHGGCLCEACAISSK